MDKCYIIRTCYHKECYMYGVCNSLYEAMKVIHEEHLYNEDTAIECIEGGFPSTEGKVIKTIFCHGKNS